MASLVLHITPDIGIFAYVLPSAMRRARSVSFPARRGKPERKASGKRDGENISKDSDVGGDVQDE